MVERNLAKVEVASSRLVSRSKYKKEATANTALPFFLQVLAQWQSGYAADCKSVYVGSIPACASSDFPKPADENLRVFCFPRCRAPHDKAPFHSIDTDYSTLPAAKDSRHFVCQANSTPNVSGSDTAP